MLPVFVVSATSLGLLGRPTLPYQIFSQLKPAIVDEVAAIDEDLWRRMYSNFKTRLQQCNATEAI
jgi:hypothetical protein